VLIEARLWGNGLTAIPSDLEIIHFFNALRTLTVLRAWNTSESSDLVTDNVSLVSGVAQRYASALLDLAEGEGVTADVERDLTAFEGMIAESKDLVRLVKSPAFSAEEQLAALSALLDKAGITGLAANFVKLATRNRRLFVLPDMIKAFRALLAEKRGEETAEVTSAAALSDEHVAALKEALSASTGKTINVAAKVDPALIGGLVVKVGSRMIDTSLRTKLNSLKFAMKEVG
jgi:F-type H+-transporting ATPase subunit delta